MTVALELARRYGAESQLISVIEEISKYTETIDSDSLPYPVYCTHLSAKTFKTERLCADKRIIQCHAKTV
jgi:hypothetical protein